MAYNQVIDLSNVQQPESIPEPTMRYAVKGVLPVTHGGTGNTTGATETALKLATARKLKTNLAATDDATFDGSADQEVIPVAGVLPVEHGGTGSSTKNFVELDGHTRIYVDAVNGDDGNDGFTEATAVKTIKRGVGIINNHAIAVNPTTETPAHILYVMPGTYSGDDNTLTFYGDKLSSAMPLCIYIKGDVIFSGLALTVNVGGSVIFIPNGDGAKVTFTAPSNASFLIRVINSSLLAFNANLDVVVDCQNIASNGSVFYCSHNAYLSLSSNITVKNATMGSGQLFYSTLQGLITNNASFTLQNNTFNHIFNVGYGCTVNNSTTNVSATNSTVTRFASVNALSLVATSSRATWASSTIETADVTSNGGVVVG
ncbi:MAG: hypothetical protein K6F46_11685 [Desulfovibrio sp.]|nr:hypothetical protein [Desulfovibrio sp.]